MIRFDVFDVFEEQLSAAEEQAAALALALERGRRSAAAAMAACLRSTIDRLERAAVLIVMGPPEAPARQHATGAALVALHGRVQPLLARSLVESVVLPVPRPPARPGRGLDPLARYRAAPGGIVDAAGLLLADLALPEADLARARLAGATLRDVIAHGADLDGADAAEARLVRVSLAASSMRGADLTMCLAEDCDFTRARLPRVRWHGGTALRCAFAGAALADLCADRVAFIDCSFLGADLAAADLGPGATMAGALFLRCDLRWTSWGDRDLAGVHFIDCKLHGVQGSPRTEGVVVRSPDMSIAGDRSRIGAPEDVLARWAAISAGSASPRGPRPGAP